MTEYVEVPFDSSKMKENATLLLAAAEELGVNQEVVRTVTGAFVVPVEVHEKAFAPRVSSGNSKAMKSTTQQKPQE